MAFVTTKTCKQCGKASREIWDPSGVCGSCFAKDATNRRKMHLAGLAVLTIEERVARIESLIYDEGAAQRIRALESRFATY